ncbi:MAG TPA: methyl-accepting chemotaxis protein [Desulfobacterales bacterium]|nr:methyl-accepting chemotaxis protein [Desulfobacterales bacterium]
MFKSISVSSRLIIVTCLLLSFALGTGLMGLKGMRDNNLVLSSVYKYELSPLNDLRALDILAHNGLVRPVDRLLFKQISWDQCLIRVNKSIHEMNKRWRSLRQIKITDADWLKDLIPLANLSKQALDRLSVILQDQDRAKLDVFSDKVLVPLADRYSEVTESLTQNRLTAMNRQYQEAQRHYQWARNVFILSLILGAVIAGIMIFMLISSINKPLVEMARAVKRLMNGDFSHRLSYDGDDEFGILIKGFNKTMDDLGSLIATVEKSGIQVTSSITEIAASAKQQEATVNEHAATSNEIAASTTEIAATSENLMDTMSKVTDMVHNTTMAASQSHKRVQNINRIMKKMENAVNSIVGKLSILNDKADNIALVTKTINKIADQTNLLSLNAAIEAEKAGEYGAGFSVVSSEIRRLADQTAVATFDIEQTVNEVQAAVNSGVMSIEKFADNVHRGFSDIQISSNQISEVISQVEALRPPIETVNEGIEAQFMGAKQISEAVGQLNEAAQQIAETVGQSSSAIEQLSMATDTLRNSVSQFNLKGGSPPPDSSVS